MTVIYEILKKDFDNSTVGLLLCKRKEKLSVESIEVGKLVYRTILKLIKIQEGRVERR